MALFVFASVRASKPFYIRVATDTNNNYMIQGTYKKDVHEMVKSSEHPD